MINDYDCSNLVPSWNGSCQTAVRARRPCSGAQARSYLRVQWLGLSCGVCSAADQRSWMLAAHAVGCAQPLRKQGSAEHVTVAARVPLQHNFSQHWNHNTTAALKGKGDRHKAGHGYVYVQRRCMYSAKQWKLHVYHVNISSISLQGKVLQTGRGMIFVSLTPR